MLMLKKKQKAVQPQSLNGKHPKPQIPEKLRPYFDLGYDEQSVSGDQSQGICTFCGKNKLYINSNTGQFDCKVCGKNGNIYTFMELFLADRVDNDDSEGEHWEELEKDRGIPLEKLQASGIVWDYDRWIIPAYNKTGSVVHLGFYKLGGAVKGIAGMPVALYGAEKLGEKARKKEPVYIQEGFWDMLAMELILEGEDEEGIAIGVPGAGTFKEQWAELLNNRELYNCYDNDLAGRKGAKTVWLKTKPFVKSYSVLSWPDVAVEGYDVRDFYRHDGSFERLSEFFVDYSKSRSEEEDEEEIKDLVEFSPISSGERPKFSETMGIYENNLLMTDDLRDALRIIFAVNISNQLPGEPLWVHIVGPSGSGKTELLTSCSEVGNTILQSTLTPHSLVSGFILPGGKDPSLLPKLFDKTFVIKDYTEILGMNKTAQDEINSILRGAYDGRVEKPFGNGQMREYKGYFTLITGVTPKIYGQNYTSLGERFLLFNIRHIPGKDMSDVIFAALSNSGNEIEMKKALQDAAKAFLEWEITKEDIPSVPMDIQKKIVNLAQLVAMLRAIIEREGNSERIAFRPVNEVGTRLAKQFFKLIQALGLLNYPGTVGEEEYRLVKRVALDTCIGWNRDALVTLAGAGDGKTAQEICKLADIPLSTIRNHLNSLVLLKILYTRDFPNPAGRGGDITRYYIDEKVKKFWEGAGLDMKKKVKGLKARKKK